MTDTANCPDAQEIGEFLLGNLPLARASAVTRHLEGCKRCRKLVDRLKQISTLDEDMPDWTPGDFPASDAMAELRTRLKILGACPPKLPETMEVRPQGGSKAGPQEDQVASGWPENVPAAAVGPAPPGYEILSRIGRGGMGIVYKAHQKKLDRIVALKFLSTKGYHWAEERNRFRIEAEAVARLQHANIVQIYEVGEQDGQPFLVLEYVDGGSLDKRLARAPMPPTAAAQLVATVSRAIHVAHEHGIIHRDLKPANVLLSAGGVPKIADFGLAKKLGPADSLTPASGAVLGTPSYMAPEQAAGKSRQATPAVDIYACGALLYDLITGRPPFKADTPVDTILQVINDEPVPAKRLQPKVPLDLDTIILKCLRKEPERRYPTALALAEDLERFLEHKPILARPVGSLTRAARWGRRHPARAAVVLLCLLIALSSAAAGLWYVQRERQDAEQARKQRDESDHLRKAAVKAEDEARRLLADSYASTAELAMRRGQWQAALTSLDKALAGSPREPTNLRLEKVRACCAVGDLTRAAQELAALTRSTSLTKEQRGLALLWEGDVALCKSSLNPDPALQKFKEALGYGLPEAQATFARALLSDTSPEAAALLSKTLTLDPYHHRAHALLGLLLVSLGRLEEARERIVVAERLFPDDATFKLLRASVLTLQNKAREAEALLAEPGLRLPKDERAAARLWLRFLDQLRDLLDLRTQLDELVGMVRGSSSGVPWRTVATLLKVGTTTAAMRGLGKDTRTLVLPLPPTVVKAYGKSAALAGQLLRADDPAKFKELAELSRVHPEGSLFVLQAALHLRHHSLAEAEQAFFQAARLPAIVPVRRQALLLATLFEFTLARQVEDQQRLKLRRRALENVRLVVREGVLSANEAPILAAVALDMKDLVLARTIIDSWERQAPKDAFALEMHASLELACGAYEKVLELTERIRALKPKSALATQAHDGALMRVEQLYRRLVAEKKAARDKK